MKIPPEFIQELKRRNPIEDIISQQVTLKRAGSNLVGLCPFHNEKTPSFTVFLNEQSYYCFGCENGGDVITYVMSINNYSYVEALEYLCKRSGIQMIDVSGIDNYAVEQRQKIYAINKEAARFYHDCLMDEKNKTAQDYVFNIRKLSNSLVTHFGIGYAPSSDRFKEYMISQGYSTKDLIDAKLLIDRENNPAFFRNRIMFPIIDTSGNVIAFGGRALGNVEPKYLNSPDTPVFKKKLNLYSLNFARKSAKESIILCEGYMDVIGFNKAGLSNAVATLGTALTQEQANIISRYTKKVILSYDSDSAGQKAIERAIPMLTQANLEVVILRLNGAKDPDEYVNKFGSDALKKAVDNSIGKINYIIDRVLQKYNIANSDDKSQAAKELCVIASRQYSTIDRNILIDEIAKKLSLDKRTISSEVERLVKIEKKKSIKKEKEDAISNLSGYNDKTNPDYVKNLKASRTEEILLGIMMVYPEILNGVRTGKYDLKADDFYTDFGKRLFERLLKDDYITQSSFLDEFTLEETYRMTKISNARKDKTDNTELVFVMNINILKNSNRELSFDEILANKKEQRKG